MDDLADWLAKLGTQGLDDLCLVDSPYGWGKGVVAARDFAAGEVVCEVPPAVLLRGDRDFGDAASDVDPQVPLAAALLRERGLGAESAYAPYIRTLPPVGELAPAHPLFWPPSVEADELLAGSVLGKTLATSALRSAAVQVAALLESGATRDEMEARWALGVVESRAFILYEDTQEWVLAPLLDVFNTFSLMHGETATWHCEFEELDPESGPAGVRMVASNPIAKGEEALHLYDSNFSATQWMKFGFVPEGEADNPWEEAGVEVPAADALQDDDPDTREAKLQVLQFLDVLPNKGTFLVLPADTGVAGRMLQVARVLACRSAQEVRSLPFPPRAQAHPALELEARAYASVEQWLESALDSNESAASAHEAALRGPVDPATPTLLRETALQLLLRERAVLEFELEVAQDFCDGVDGIMQDPASRRQFEDKYWSETGL